LPGKNCFLPGWCRGGPAAGDGFFAAPQNILKIFSRRFPAGGGRVAATAGTRRQNKFKKNKLKFNNLLITNPYLLLTWQFWGIR
jgi:hypothetical protein